METNAKRGRLISLEGIECSGKGTQIKLLTDYLRELDIPAIASHEPGGTAYGEAMRALIKHPEIALPAIFMAFQGHSDFPEATSLFKQHVCERTPEAELLMFEVARAEFSAGVIEPNLSRGVTIVCDRLHDSTTAYQGGGRMLDLQTDYRGLINRVNLFALRGLKPDLTFYLDIPVEVMLERVAKQNDEKNAHFERTCKPEFFQRVRRAYLEIAKQEPRRFIVIDGDQPPATVFKFIQPYIDELFPANDDTD